MKIGVYDPYLDTVGGGEKYMLTLAASLAKHHDVAMLWDDTSVLEKIQNRFALELEKVSFAENIFNPRIPTLERLKKAKQYDYIVFLSDGSIPFLPTTKTIIHFQFPVEWIKPNLAMKLKLAKIHRVICNSYFTKSYIDKKFGINSDVLYPPVSLRVPEKIEKENIILHVGRFGITSDGFNYKKQDVLIEAFKKMVDGGLKKWKFVLVTGVREEDVERVKKLEASAKGYPIEFVINATNKTLWEMYAKAKIYWHASGYGEDLQKHPEYAEHFGISTVEAMGAGVVPVVINAGGQKEIVHNEKNGLLWNSVEELMSNTDRVIVDTKLWEVLSDNAQKRARDFSEEAFSEQINQIVK